MKLSIIVPVYNVKEYLDDCISSVLNQPAGSWEIIIVDDGSTDGSAELCDKWANRGGIKVIHQENKGLSGARNAGIRASHGDYLLFLDSDDTLVENSLEQILFELDKNRPDLLVGKAYSVNKSGERKPKVKYTTNEGLYSRNTFLYEMIKNPKGVAFCAQYWICSKALIEKHGLRFIDRLIHEDEVWTPQLILTSETIYFMDEYFYNHLIRDGSIMHNDKKEASAQNTIKCCEYLNKLYERYPKNQTKYLRDRMSMLFMRSIPNVGKEERKAIIESFGKNFAFRNANTFRNKGKGLLLLISPDLYCIASKKI